MTARRGDTVKVSYCVGEDRLGVACAGGDDGRFEFTIGKGQVITGFEEQVIGMQIGEEKTVEVPMDKAFGRWNEENFVVLKRDRLPRGLALDLGRHLYLRAGGRRAVVTVADTSETTVTLNTNHPLSGKNLIFRIKLLGLSR